MIVPVLRAEDSSTRGSTFNSSEESQEEGLELAIVCQDECCLES